MGEATHTVRVVVPSHTHRGKLVPKGSTIQLRASQVARLGNRVQKVVAPATDPEDTSQATEKPTKAKGTASKKADSDPDDEEGESPSPALSARGTLTGPTGSERE